MSVCVHDAVRAGTSSAVTDYDYLYLPPFASADIFGGTSVALRYLKVRPLIVFGVTKGRTCNQVFYISPLYPPTPPKIDTQTT